MVVTVTDALGAPGTVTYTLAVAEPAPVAAAVTATVAANSSANAISASLSGGTATSVAIGTMPSHGTVTVSGLGFAYTPTAGYSGADSFTYTASNATGTSAPATVTITVTAPTLSLDPAAGALTVGTAGVAYSETFSADLGTAPYSFEVSAGTLPAGLTLAASGTLSGTPTADGSFSFTVKATDTYGAIGTAAYRRHVGDCHGGPGGRRHIGDRGRELVGQQHQCVPDRWPCDLGGGGQFAEPWHSHGLRPWLRLYADSGLFGRGQLHLYRDQCDRDLGAGDGDDHGDGTGPGVRALGRRAYRRHGGSGL